MPLLASALLLVAASCSAEGHALREIEASLPVAVPTPATATAATPVEVATSTPAVEPTAADDAANVAPLRMALVGEPVTDPARAAPVRPTDMVVVDLLYDGLSRWDAAAGTWLPSLADSFVEADDGLSWTVTLTDATFSDGSLIDADAVVRSLERIRSGDLSLAATRLEMIDTISAVDSRTVRFDLRDPFALLPELLSSPVYGVVPDPAPDGSTGSGPFVLVGSVLTPRSVRAPELSGFGGVELVTFADDGAAVAGYEAGDVDLVYVPVDHRGPVDVAVGSAVEAHFILNTAAPQLGTPSVRADVVAAVSRTVVSLAGFGDAAVPVDQIVPEMLACVDPCGGDVDAVSVSFESPIAIAYAEEESGREAALAEALVGELHDAAIPAVATGYDVATFVSRVAAGRDDLFRAGWVGLFPSPDSQLSPFTSTSPDNTSAFADAEFDAAFAAARRSGDPSAYLDAQTLLARQSVALPIARLQVRALVSDAVTGLLLRHDGTFEVDTLRVSGSGS